MEDGGRRGWNKRHLGVDRSGVIVARALTAEARVDDALGRVTADAAYETIGFYEAAGARGATVVVPPTSTANVSRHDPRSSARDHTIVAVKEIGRRRPGVGVDPLRGPDGLILRGRENQLDDWRVLNTPVRIHRVAFPCSTVVPLILFFFFGSPAEYKTPSLVT